MSLRVVVLGGNCPWGSCPMGVIVLQGSCPRGNCPQGSCPRTVDVCTKKDCEFQTCYSDTDTFSVFREGILQTWQEERSSITIRGRLEILS